MFGRNNDDTKDDNQTDDNIALHPFGQDPATDAPAGTQPAEELSLPTPTGESTGPEMPMPSMESEAPSEAPTAPEPEQAESLESPHIEQDATEYIPVNVTSDSTAPVSSSPSNLDDLKSQALQALSPLVQHLDQSPDEKYATAKMIYTENKTPETLNAVYEAAKNLTDDKTKAHALLEVIEEIKKLQ